MMTVQETTDYILNSDKPAWWLKVLDVYVQQYNHMPSSFVLPHEYRILEPVLAAIARKPEKLPAYIKAIRDTLPRGPLAQDVNALYRTVMTRIVQQERRARMARALDKAADLFGPLDKDQRLRYESKLFTLWGRRRQELLSRAANHTASSRLSVEERAEILALFWKDIDDEIEAGQLPPVE